MSFNEIGNLTDRPAKKKSIFNSFNNETPKKKNIRYLKIKNQTHNANIKLAENLYTRDKIYNFENKKKITQRISYTDNNNNNIEIKHLTPKNKRTLKIYQSQKNFENLNLNKNLLKKNNSNLYKSYASKDLEKNFNKKNILKSLILKKKKFSKTKNPLKTSIDLYFKKKSSENSLSNYFTENKKKSKIIILPKKKNQQKKKRGEIPNKLLKLPKTQNQKLNKTQNKELESKLTLQKTNQFSEKFTIHKKERNYQKRLKNLEKENKRLKSELEDQLSAKRDTYKKKYLILKKDHQILKEKKLDLEKNMSKKLFHMYLQTEKNNRKNFEAHTRELSYRYGCNNDETIVLLKDYVKELKENLRIIQCDTEKYYCEKYEKVIEEKDNQIEILKELLDN